MIAQSIAGTGISEPRIPLFEGTIDISSIISSRANEGAHSISTPSRTILDAVGDKGGNPDDGIACFVLSDAAC